MNGSRLRLSCHWTNLLAAVLVVVGCRGEKEELSTAATKAPAQNSSSIDRPPDFLVEARRMVQLGEWDSASELVYKALLQNPENGDAKLLASEVEAERGNHQAAVDFVSSIDIQSRLGKRAVEVHYQQLLKLNRRSEALDVILAGINVMPLQIEWRHQAWVLLNRAGRCEEASRQAVFICQRGEMREVELLSLIQRTDSFPFTLGSQEDPADYFDSGLGMARWYFTQRQYDLALQELSHEYETGFKTQEACAFYGRLLGESQAFERMPEWFAKCDAKTRNRGDFWAALGAFFIDRRQYEASARALLEAVYRNPTDLLSVQRLAMVFDTVGRPELSTRFQVRAGKIASTKRDSRILSESPSDDLARKWMVQNLMDLGRPFETIGWMLTTLPRDAVRKRAELVAKRGELGRDGDALVMAFESAIVGIDFEQFQLEPALGEIRRASQSESGSNQVTKNKTSELNLDISPRLVNVAKQVGVDFQWYLDTDINLEMIALHEALGGGIAVIDYDLDGWPDIYLAQGSGDPPTDACTRSNVLLRNTQAQFNPVTSLAVAEDYNYSSGLAVGDVNQDGFCDLVLGSIGRNRLLINNGDGTFRDATEKLGSTEDRFSSSLAVADVTGDALPDLFVTNYVEMEGAFVLPFIDEAGQLHAPRPLTHKAAADQCFENKGDGGFEAHDVSGGFAEPASSLGIMVTDFNSNGSNEIFVANDLLPNHFLYQGKNDEFRNLANAKGIANGFDGRYNACMGIASGDFNRDGKLDLHVTNFNHESSNLFLQTSGSGFTDFAVRYGLESLTLPMVGFGTKAIDVDRNGWLDLLVSNGHVFDLPQDDQFEMPPQLLMNLGSRFEQVPVEDESNYWKQKYLGRSLASLDFDRDGSIDFLVGHLDQPVALLHNETRTDGQWIQFELVGKTSERDAIGARIVVTAGGEQFAQWVTAGDGYLCSDESVVDFGLGDKGKLDSVQIHWPKGDTQIFLNLDPGHRYLIIEGEQQAYRR